MPLPLSVPVGSVSGTWFTPSGALATGRITFTLLAEIDVPDQQDAIVLPIFHEFMITAGTLDEELPAAFYAVSLELTHGYKSRKTIEVVAGLSTNIPASLDRQPPPNFGPVAVLTVGGVAPDGTGNVSVPTDLILSAAVDELTDQLTEVDARNVRDFSGQFLDPQARKLSTVPVPTTVNYTASTTLAPFTYPCWLSNNGNVTYAVRGFDVVTSTDEGSTWTLLRTFTQSPSAVRQMSNGDLLVATKTTGVAGQLWKYSNGTWTLVLTSSATSTAFQPQWGMSVEGGSRILVSEYGTKIPTATTAPRYVWLSQDFGSTWTVVYDLGNVTDGHIHGCAYDAYWDRLWVVTGDSTNRRIVYSDNLGATWVTVSAGARTNQMVGILPMRGCILFTTDSSPNAIMRIRRVDKATVPSVVEIAHLVEDAATLVTLGGQHYQRNSSSPALFPFVRTGGAGVSRLIATNDGEDFFVIWTSPANFVNDGSGLQSVMGPTTSGNLIGTVVNDAGSGGVFKSVCPVFRVRASKFSKTVITTFAQPASTKGAAFVANTLIGSGLPALDVRFCGTHPTWVATTQDDMVSKYLGSDPNREWLFVLRPDGRIQLKWYPTALSASLVTAVSTVVPTLAGANKRLALRATLTPNNGAGGWSVLFYESANDGTTWTQIGTTVTGAGVTSLPAATSQPLCVGAEGSGLVAAWPGRVHWADVKSVIGDYNSVARVDFSSPQYQLGDIQPLDAMSPAPEYTDKAGNAWTLVAGTRIQGASATNTEAYMYRPTITGSRATATPLTQLLEALVAAGLIIDSTTA